MAMPRKTKEPMSLGVKKRMPKRIVLFSIVRDESGSMRNWRTQQGQFVPRLIEKLRNAAGSSFINSVYVQYTVISGGHVSTKIAPLEELADPTYVPDGSTPLGTALGSVSDTLKSFVEQEVFPEEVTVRNFEVLVISDCEPTGEKEQETLDGIDRFVQFAKTYNAKIQVVVPDEAAKKNDLVKRINVSDRPCASLDVDPQSLINITFESLYAASRKLGRSDMAIRNRS